MARRTRTLTDALEQAAGRPAAGLRFVDRDERPEWHPWSRILEGSRRVAGSLQALGIRPTDGVALVYPTGPEFFEAFFGVLLAGAVPVPLYPPVRLGRLDEYHRGTGRMLEAARARLVLTDRRLRAVLRKAVDAARPPLGCSVLEALPRGRYRSTKVHPDDLGLVQFSSGTTAEPKPVALSHRAILTQAVLLNRFWPDHDGVRHSGASWLPLYHDMGLIGCVMPALERPATLTLLPPEAFVARPAIWLRAISKYGVTVSPAPNFAYGLCVDKIRDDELKGVDLSTWKVALNGAEAVVPSVARAFQQRFARWGFAPEAMTPVYGLSEAALAVSFSRLDRKAVTRRFDRTALAERGRAVQRDDGIEIASVGTPLPGFELRIVDDRGASVPPGHVGRVTVAGPSLMQGYLDQPELTREVLRDGWLDTGDLGFVAEGELFLTGRAKDMLLLRGRNHAPGEVESAVDVVERVRTGCAVAVSWLPEDASGEVLFVFVETSRGTRRNEHDRIADECSRAVISATGLAPDRVVVLEAGTLPRTSSGKLRRQETLHRHLADRLHAPRRPTLLGLATTAVRSRWTPARSSR